MTNNQQLKAHCEDVIANPQDHRDWVVDMAKEALAALTQPASPALKLPDGWVAVPLEPTEEMIAAGDRFMDGLSRLGDAYDSMLEAAPDVPHTAPIEPICATGGAKWVKVPREPTQKMIDAHMDGMVKGGAMTAYRQMLAAADELSN